MTSWAVVGSKGVDWKDVVGAVSCDGVEEEEDEAFEEVDDGFLPVRVPQRDMLTRYIGSLAEQRREFRIIVKGCLRMLPRRAESME